MTPDDEARELRDIKNRMHFVNEKHAIRYDRAAIEADPEFDRIARLMLKTFTIDASGIDEHGIVKLS